MRTMKCVFYLKKDLQSKFLRPMFELSYENIRHLLPIDSDKEKNYQIYLSRAVPHFDYNVLLFDDNNIVVGYLQYRIIDQSIYLDDIQIKSGHQNKGYLKEMIETAIPHIPNNTKNIYCSIEKANFTARSIAEKYHLKEVSESEDGFMVICQARYHDVIKNNDN